MTRRRDRIARWGLAALLAGTGAAHAQPISGLYLGAGVGYGLLSDQSTTSPAAPTGKARFDGGIVALGSGGYGFGNGLRLELEGGWRDNTQSGGVPGNGSESGAGLMFNVLFDFDAGLPWLYPYVGLGGGYQWTRWSGIGLPASTPGGAGMGSLIAGGTVATGAYQGIVGLAVPITAVPGLAVTAEYRYFALAGGRTVPASLTLPSGHHVATTAHSSDNSANEVLVGLRYAFDAASNSAGVPRPKLAAPPDAPVPTRTYLVFFDWDSAALSARARDIIAEAARNSVRVQHTRLEVSGHADRTGPEAVNQALSLRRAQVVADELVRWGIKLPEIDVHAYGDTQPLVPTEAGVREPQNRRVEIVYR